MLFVAFNTACSSPGGGPDFRDVEDLAGFVAVADRYVGPYEIVLTSDELGWEFRWDGKSFAGRQEPASPIVEWRAIAGVGCFQQIDDRWVWEAGETLPRPFGAAIEQVVPVGIGLALRDSTSTLRRSTGGLRIDVPNGSGVDHAQVKLDEGHLESITWYSGRREVGRQTFSFHPEPVQRPEQAAEGMDVTC